MHSFSGRHRRRLVSAFYNQTALSTALVASTGSLAASLSASVDIALPQSVQPVPIDVDIQCVGADDDGVGGDDYGVVGGEDGVAGDDDDGLDKRYPDDVDFDDMCPDEVSEDEEEDDSEDLTEVEGFLGALRLWVVESNQTVTAVDKLLKVISDKLPSVRGVPRTHRTLMKTPKESALIRDVSPGKYTHFGIQNFMYTICDARILARDEIVIDIGIDGAPLARTVLLSP